MSFLPLAGKKIFPQRTVSTAPFIWGLQIGELLYFKTSSAPEPIAKCDRNRTKEHSTPSAFYLYLNTERLGNYNQGLVISKLAAKNFMIST